MASLFRGRDKINAAVLKAALFWLSRSRRVERFARHFGPARAVTRRFVAGDRLEDFLEAAMRLTGRGFRVIADHLGESVTNEESAARAADEYIRVVEALAEKGIPRPYISLKLTQLGLDFGFETARASLRRVLQSAKKCGVFTRLDMESSAYVERTLQLYRENTGEFPALGVVLQSMLRRSLGDAEALIPLGVNVRLVKGAYLESPEAAFQSKAEVNAAFDEIAERLMRPSALSRGVFLAIATHDPTRIERFLALARGRKVPQEHYEFQMLYGIRTDLQEHLRASGEPVRIYIPYGSEWYPYMMRRMAERPANLWFVAKNLLRR
jgi:proline dehydrogenase